MLCFNILYTDYKDQQLYHRSIKCQVDQSDSSYNVTYNTRHIGKTSLPNVEKSFTIEKHIIEHTDEAGNINYKVKLLPSKDAIIYTNSSSSNGSSSNSNSSSPQTMSKRDNRKMKELVNYLSTMLFVSVPKYNSSSPENVKILVDYERLDELIKKYDYELLVSFMINVNIYDKQGVFHMIRNHENKNKNKNGTS